MDLNTLSNKDLREMCLQYDLPNVPVTDSTRKVLIRKLNAVMTGTVEKSKNKAVPKVASPLNRRKTVHTTISATVSSADEDEVVITKNPTVNTNFRRTVAPIPQETRNTSIFNKLPNEHVVPLEIASRPSSTRINTYAPSLISESPHDRRSVSLSKTGVLTTSYNQQTVPLPSYEHDFENNYEEMEDEIDDVEMESVPDTENIYSKHFYTADDNNKSNYTATNYNPTNYNANNYTTATFIKPATPPVLSTNKPNLYPNLQETMLQTADYSSADGIRASHSSSARQTNLGFKYNPSTSYSPSPQATSSANRQTIGGYGYDGGVSVNRSPTTKRYSVATKRHTARAIDDEAGASSSDDQYEAPYLSKFSRNLDTLKTDPLLKRSSSNESTSSPISSRYSNYSPAAPKRRRATYENGVTFGEFWTSFEQKYHLKQAFFFILCFLVAVFIYVFFLQ